MSTCVSVRVPKIQPVWRTVVVSLSVRADVGDGEPRDIVRAWVTEIAERNGIPKKRTNVRGAYSRGEYRGYIRVYSGTPKEGDLALFKRVERDAVEVATRTRYRIMSREEVDSQIRTMLDSLPARSLN